MSFIRENPVIKELLSLNFPSEDYAVFGSGPMFAHGLKDVTNDLDLITRGKAWEMTKSLGVVRELAPGYIGIKLFDDRIEIGNTWSPGEWDIDKLIDEADTIEGIRFVQLKDVLKWKRILGRPKDLEHIKIITSYLNSQNISRK